MLTSSKVFGVIEKIASTSSKNEKQALVNEHIDDPMFKQVLVAALDPTVTYGISKRPEALPLLAEVREFNGTEFTLLSNLKTRALTGDAAIQAIQQAMQALDIGSAELLWRIIKKDLRAGFGDSTVNKACKGLIPTFPYMRCVLPKDSDIENWDWSIGHFSQEKADGMFMNMNIESHEIQALTSRAGTAYPHEPFESLLQEAASRLQHGYQYHGEMLVYRNGQVLPRAESNGVINHVEAGGQFAENEEPRFFIWDAIPLSVVLPKGKYEVPYVDRLAGIVKTLQTTLGRQVALIETRPVCSYAEAKQHAGELMKEGKEGTIVKHRKMGWKDTGSSGYEFQVKIKLEFNVDLQIDGIVPGEEGTKTEGRAGSFACSSSDGLLKVNVTVKNEALRDAVDANPDGFIGKILSVTANDIMEPSESNPLHSLFLPRMAEKSYRTDKHSADDLETIKATKHAAIFGQELKDAA